MTEYTNKQKKELFIKLREHVKTLIIQENRLAHPGLCYIIHLMFRKNILSIDESNALYDEIYLMKPEPGSKYYHSMQQYTGYFWPTHSAEPRIAWLNYLIRYKYR